MAESVLKEIIEQVVLKTENNLRDEEISRTNENALGYVDTNGKTFITLENEGLKEVVREEIKDSDEMKCLHIETDKDIESESELSDEIPTDENNNDMLTTEDEAEDFLKHVLRDTNDSDEGSQKESKGFELSAEGCESMGGTFTETEKDLNLASALANIVDAHIITESEEMVGQTDMGQVDLTMTNRMKLPVVQESDSAFSNHSSAFSAFTSDISTNHIGKVSDVPVNHLDSTDITVQPVKSGSVENGKKSDADINNNNTDVGSSNNLFDDNRIFKYDWSKCYNPYVTDNRDLSTPDAEMENISPELSCMMQLSPTATYGKDHTIGCQRLYSRQHPQSVTSGSTLNTPDPIFYEDTDSNESNMAMFRKYNVTGTENPIPPWPVVDANNNYDANEDTKGTKRKFGDVGNPDEVGPSPHILPDSVVTSIMNQGRPPDISTWRAVNSSCDTQGNFMNDDINGQWSKPTCTVPPFQSSGLFSDTLVNGINGFGTNQEHAMYTASVYNPYEHVSNFSVPQQPYNQYNLGNAFLRSSCQFTTNQARNPSNCGSHMYNNGLHNAAAYRLDFSSPVNFGAPGLLNFVSHPPYLGVDLTRPQAVHANSLPTTDIGASLRNSSFPDRHVLNTSEFRNFYQPQSKVFQQVPCGNPYMNQLNETKCIFRPPSATQTFVESQNNSQGPASDHMIEGSDETEELNQALTAGARDSNNNKKLNTGESSAPEEEDKTSIVGCEECDLITESNVDHERTKAEKSSDKSHNVVDKRSMKAKCEEPTDKETSAIDKLSVNQDSTLDKAVQSNEADSTTIDLTGDSVEEDKGEGINDKTGGTGSPTPADAYQKVQNKYFTEIFMRKSRTSSPITSFCTALDLSKREEKKDIKKAARPTAPQKILPYGEPSIPISAVLNSVQAPTLAYSGAMLVPYMNSIFAAMANMNKTQTASMYSSDSTSANPTVNTCMAQTVQNTPTVSQLTQTNNLTLNQQVLMYSNLLQASRSVVSTSATSETSGQSQTTVNGETVSAPTVNMNSIPLPLYAAPIQYPIRPLVPVVNQIGSAQGLVNPCMYRFNLGVPLQTIPSPNIPLNTASTIDANNNTISSTVSSSSIFTSTVSAASSKAAKTASVKAKKSKSAAAQKKRPPRKSPINRRGTAVNLKKSTSLQDAFIETSAPALRKSVSAVDGLNMSIQGSNFSSVTRTQSRGLVTYQPVPEGRMFQSIADQKKKVFKAKHYPFTTLHIGSYQYSCGPSCNDKIARVKFLFSKKLMVYEFQLDSPDGSPTVFKDMVEIAVPFWSITSLWLYDKDMRVEVKDSPKICLGKKGPDKNMGYKFNNAAVYNRKLRMDITDGEVSTSPYHYIQFKNTCADRIKAELREFDSRFVMMLRLPLIEDSAKSLIPGTKQPLSQLLDPSICLPKEDINNNDLGPVYQPEENRDVSVLVSCSCTGGCSAESCQCCVKGTTCMEGMCDCVNCRNPLNILHQLGLPAERARTDPCLMENIYQIKRLDCYVKTQLVLECCHIPVLLFNCIPGEIRCANGNCTARYKYSWCTARLLNEDSSPRNHCIKCGRCTDYRNEHCQKCKICYFAGESRTFKCPVCHNRSKEAVETDSSTDSDI